MYLAIPLSVHELKKAEQQLVDSVADMPPTSGNGLSYRSLIMHGLNVFFRHLQFCFSLVSLADKL